MRYAVLAAVPLLLVGCGNEPEPNPPKPHKICTAKEEVKGLARGTFYNCIEWEFGCIKPLRMAQEESGKLICRLPKE